MEENSALKNCYRAWVALSARLDGEFTDEQTSLSIDAHLLHCNLCSLRLVTATALRGQVRVGTAVPGPDLSESIMTAIRVRELQRVQRQQRAAAVDPAVAVRLVLAILAVLQTVGALIHLFGVGASWAMPAAAHLSKERAVMEIAVAVAFGTAAAKPDLVAALIPMASAVAIGLFGTAIIDTVSGATEGGFETGHTLALGGALALVVLQRSVRPRSAQPQMRSGFATR
jgi:predicted anti-sigma-YlaC factor YlaD